MSNELFLAVNAAMLAGKETLRYYQKDIKVELKNDSSPLTEADKSSNDLIVKQLIGSELPILSEEIEQKKYKERKNWPKFWLIDPLDGTKEFINKSDEYTVNIALVEDNYPILGVVYAPAKDLLFYGSQKHGAYKVEKASKFKSEDLFKDSFKVKLPLFKAKMPPVVVASKMHLNEKTSGCIEQIKKYFGTIKLENYGSSLKLCMVAEGTADIYPRIGPTMEWDTAASQVIVEAAGHYMVQFPELTRMEYNKKDLHNPYFIVFNHTIKKAVNEIFTA